MRRAPLVLAALALLCGCPKRVAVGGEEAPPDVRARAAAELARLRVELADAPPERKAPAFEALAARSGEAPEAAEALYDAGLAWRAARRPERASADFGQLLTRFPLSPRAMDAKLQLGLSQVEEGHGKDGLQTLGTLYDKLPPGERLPAARAAARAAERSGQWAAAVRFRAETAKLAAGAERDEELRAAADAIDQLPVLDVARLREEAQSDSPVLAPLMLKLAKVRWHLRDADGAQGEARELVRRFPGTPFAAEGQALLDRLARRVQAQPNVLGVAVPLSGRNKAWGEAILQGVTMALDGGGFRLVVKDTRGEPDGAAQALEELALAEGAIAVIGGVTNAEAARAAQAAQELELPFLSLAKTERITEAGPWVFRVMLTAEAQARGLVDWAARRGMKRFAVLYPNIPYGLELAGAFWDEVEAHGGEMRGAEPYEHDRTTFAPQVKSLVGKLYLDERPDYVEQVKELVKEEKDPFRRRKALEKLRERIAPVTDFDAVFVPDFARNVGYVAPALAVEDVVTSTCDAKEVEKIRKTTGREDLQPVQLLGANGWNDPQLVERSGKYVECAVFVDGFFAGSQRPETRKFVEGFQKKFEHPPTILEASAHDAARLLRLALERGAKTREALRGGLLALKAVPGATGDLSFDERREVQKGLFFLTVENKVVRELTPAELAGGPPPAPPAQPGVR